MILYSTFTKFSPWNGCTPYLSQWEWIKGADQFGQLFPAEARFNRSHKYISRWKGPKGFFTNVVEAYKLSSSKYVQKYAKNVEYNLEKKLMNLSMWSSTPLLPSSRPEMDAPPALILSDNIYFQLLIGVIIWAVKLGRIDITCGV